ncbi:MAG: M23 family metallopeptidase [Acidobacteria bacterium]|nr:M23 family metallopeptidase [Acidobacteriota bacterium]
MSLKTILLSVAVLLVVAGGVTYYLAGQEPGPIVTIHGPSVMGSASVTFDASVDVMGTRLTRVEARLEQADKQFPVFSLASPGDARFVQETPDRMRLTRAVASSQFGGLKDGTARLVITAERLVLLGLRKAESTTSRDVKVRLTPPAITVVSTHHYVKLGGAEMIVYRVAPPDVSSGVQVGDRYYPGFPAAGVGGSKSPDPTLRLAFFSLAFDQDVDTRMTLVARDEAGNMVLADFDHKTFPGKFERSRVPIDDTFVSRVVPPILQATPELKMPTGKPEERLAAFLAINSDVRRKNAQQIEAIAKESGPEMLWRGPFLRMARAASAAVFADHRTYFYGDREVDRQVHLGVDLASVRGAEVTAANTGRVMYTGYLGIYGNCVIIDHGMGVQTLYAHLSAMDVEKGDSVKGGETIGRSGMTGLAGGDHVHFTTLVAGRPVNPVEWWDPHWIADRIDRKLFEAGLIPEAPKVAAATTEDKPAPARVKAKPKPKPKPRPPVKPRRKR